MSATFPDPRIAAAKRVVKRHDTAPLIREVDQGTVEVVSARRGRIYRHYVDPAGSTTLVERGDRLPGWVAGRATLILGFALLFSVFFAPAVLGHEDARLLLVALCGFVLTWVGYGIEKRTIANALRALEHDDAWFPFLTIAALRADKPPLTLFTLPQLRSVEKLLVEDQLLLVVRVQGDGGVEVVTASERVLRRNLIDREGAAYLIDTAPSAHFRSLKSQAQRRYGGRREDWFEIDLRPNDGD